MFASVKMLALENLTNAFNKKAGTLKQRESLSLEFARRAGKVLNSVDQEKLRSILLEFAKNWK